MNDILKIFKIRKHSIYSKCENSVFIFQEVFCAMLQGKKVKQK